MKQKLFVSRQLIAFTLVELLVVIGIIAVLISMLMPALSRARESSLTIKCASVLHQYAMAVNMYANNNNSYLPGGENNAYTPGAGTLITWTQCLIAAKGITGQNNSLYWPADAWRCPENQTIDPSFMSYGPAMGEYTDGGKTAGGINADPPYGPAMLTKISEVHFASQVPYLCEMYSNSGVYCLNASVSASDPTSGYHIFGLFYNIHNHGTASNVLFVDGHVALIPKGDFLNTVSGIDAWNFHFCIASSKPNW